MPRPSRSSAVAIAARRPVPNPQPARTRQVWRWLRLCIIGVIWSSVLGFVLLLWFAWDLPRPEAALAGARRPSLSLQDSAGRTFATYGDVAGESMRLSDLPRWMPEAAVDIEDRRFWRHGAIDLLGIARAAEVDLLAFRIVQGGSTITQQVAKTLFLSNARTLRRKVQELLLTVWLEHTFTKQEILEIWLNRVYLGAGAWGVDAAARVYFGISARSLNLWQSAMLAGLPRAPSRFNPRVDPQAAIARTKQVLAAMVEAGDITADQAARAAAAISIPAHPASGAPWFADWAAERSQTLLPSGADAVVQTTLDSRLQGIVEHDLSVMLAGPGAKVNAGQGAVVVLNAATGAVRAMAGGRDYSQSSYNRATVARRQPGSAFKPFVWLTALENGATPDDTVLDAPIRIGKWSPTDFEPGYRGRITLREALAHSVNTAAVRLLLRAGPGAVIATAHKLGIADKLPRNASLALGTGDVGLLELAAAYAPFFNGGKRVEPHAIERLMADRHLMPLSPDPPEQVITPPTAAMMASMLGSVVAEGTGTAAAIPGRFVGGKTGTTQDFRDAWFIGFTGGAIIGVWMGNDDGTPMHGITGGSLPARLFHEIGLAVGR